MNSKSSLKCDRQKFVGGLKDYLDSCQKTVTSLLQTLDWSPEHFVQSESGVKCKYNENHVMPAQIIEKHEQICPLMERGYSKTEAEEISQSNDFYYENASHVGHVPINKEVLNKVLWDFHVRNQTIFYGQSELPATRDEEPCQLSPQERAAIHSFAIDKVKENKEILKQEVDDFLTTNLQNIVTDKITKDDGSAPKSYLEYIQAQRDYKRRRQSYRAKNVHITKKSYTEIIREVIENQTELFASFVRQEEEESRGDTKSIERKTQRSTEKDEHHSRENRDRSDTDQSPGPSRNGSEERLKRHHKRSKERHQHGSKDRYRDRPKSGHGDLEQDRPTASDYDSDSDPSSSRKYKKHHKKHKKHKHKSVHKENDTLQ